jgi:hypothetical protein
MTNGSACLLQEARRQPPDKRLNASLDALLSASIHVVSIDFYWKSFQLFARSAFLQSDFSGILEIRLTTNTHVCAHLIVGAPSQVIREPALLASKHLCAGGNSCRSHGPHAAALRVETWPVSITGQSNRLILISGSEGKTYVQRRETIQSVH